MSIKLPSWSVDVSSWSVDVSSWSVGVPSWSVEGYNQMERSTHHILRHGFDAMPRFAAFPHVTFLAVTLFDGCTIDKQRIPRIRNYVT